MCVRVFKFFYEFYFCYEIGQRVESTSNMMGGVCLRLWGGISILLSGWAASELVRAENTGGLRCKGMLRDQVWIVTIRGRYTLGELVFCCPRRTFRRRGVRTRGAAGCHSRSYLLVVVVE